MCVGIATAHGDAGFPDFVPQLAHAVAPAGGIAIAQASTFGMETFGASAPLRSLQKKLGLPDRVVLFARELSGKG